MYATQARLFVAVFYASDKNGFSVLRNTSETVSYPTLRITAKLTTLVYAKQIRKFATLFYENTKERRLLGYMHRTKVVYFVSLMLLIKQCKLNSRKRSGVYVKEKQTLQTDSIQYEIQHTSKRYYIAYCLRFK